MSESPDPLLELFAESQAPARDPAFTLAVIAEVERREALRATIRRLAYTALAFVLLVAGWPAFAQMSAHAGGDLVAAAPFLAIALLAIGVNYADRLRDLSAQLVRLPGISHL